MIAVKSKHAT